MRRVHKNVCPFTISASIMATNMWKNSLKNVESDNNKILYEKKITRFFFQRKGTYCLNKPRILRSQNFNSKKKWSHPGCRIDRDLPMAG